MDRYLPHLCALLTLSLLFAITSDALPRPAAEPQNDAGIIRGAVFRAGTEEPIPEVTVTLITSGTAGNARGFGARGGAAASVAGTAATDREGQFVFRGIPSGVYQLRVEREGYFARSASGQYSTAGTSVVTVAPGQQGSSISVFLLPGSVLSGRVLDPSGRPAVGLSVQAFNRVYENGATVLRAAASGTTDDRGDYRLFRVLPGDYYVGVTPSGAPGALFTARGARAPGMGDATLPTFYPAAADLSGALPVSLRSGEELTGININMRGLSTVTVSGQISSTIPLIPRVSPRGTSTPLSVQLLLVPREGAVLPNGTRMSVPLDESQTGRFQLTGVTPGIYDLYARVPNNAAALAGVASAEPTAYFGRTSFEARYEDVQGLSVVIRPGVNLRVKATVDGTTNFTKESVRILLRPAENGLTLTTSSAGASGAGSLSDDGYMDFPFVNEGLYRLQANVIFSLAGRGQGGPADSYMNAYVDDIREGGVSVYDSGLKIGTEPPGPVEVLIKTNGGTVQGVVSHSQQKPKAGAVVVVALVPSGSRRQNPALFKTVLTSELLAGRFVFRGVQPGPYKVFAWENIVPAVIQDPAFLAKYEQRGHAILVNPSTTTAADIDLISSQE